MNADGREPPDTSELPVIMNRLPAAASGAAGLHEMDLDPHRRGQARVNEVNSVSQKDTARRPERQCL
jgi:hypothetical protein